MGILTVLHWMSKFQIIVQWVVRNLQLSGRKLISRDLQAGDCRRDKVECQNRKGEN